LRTVSVIAGAVLLLIGQATSASADCGSEKTKCQLECEPSGGLFGNGGSSGDPQSCRATCDEKLQVCLEREQEARHPKPAPNVTRVQPQSPVPQTTVASPTANAPPASSRSVPAARTATRKNRASSPALVGSVCTPGAIVSPVRPTSLDPADTAAGTIPGSENSSDIGNELIVDRTSPVSGDRCNVLDKNGYRGPKSGSVLIADIAPIAQVRATLSQRAYNQPEKITLAEFPEKFRAALSKPRPDNSYPPPSEAEIARIVQVVTYCSQLTFERLSADLTASMEPNPTTTARAAEGECISLGAFGNPAREGGVRVGIGPRVEKTQRPYEVLLMYDGGESAREQYEATYFPSSGLLDYYDKYGIGNYFIVGN
jgi:hypothetical protein